MSLRTTAKIIQRLAREFSITPQEILKSSRGMRRVLRDAVIHTMSQRMGYRHVTIAQEFGICDKTSSTATNRHKYAVLNNDAESVIADEICKNTWKETQ